MDVEARRGRWERIRIAILIALFEVSAVAMVFLPGGLWPRRLSPGSVPPLETRLISVFGLPTALALIVAIFARLSSAFPRRPGPESSRRSSELILTFVVMAVAGIHLVLLGTLLGAGRWMGTFPPLCVGLALVAAGNVLPRVRPDAALAIRTPWTLLDEGVWAKTHRAAGYGGMGFGLTLVACALAALAWSWAVVLAAALAGLAGLPLLSFLFWRLRRSDPDHSSDSERRA